MTRRHLASVTHFPADRSKDFLFNQSPSGSPGLIRRHVAGWCVKKGGDRASCFDAQRMAACKASGTYAAPSGRDGPLPANKREAASVGGLFQSPPRRAAFV